MKLLPVAFVLLGAGLLGAAAPATQSVTVTVSSLVSTTSIVKLFF